MDGISTSTLPVVRSRDRHCPGWALDNRLRRWWAPPEKEVALLAVGPGQHVADLGAGVGYLTSTLLDLVGPEGSVDLVDPNPRALAVAQRRWGADPRVRLAVSSAAHVPTIESGTIDRVVLSLVLCCMVEKTEALDETWRILRPGGLALVSYPERRWRLSRRKVALRVSPELWARLVVEHPWRVLSSARKRLIRRHVLQKPTVPG